MRRMMCSMGLNNSTVFGKSSSSLSDRNQNSKVRRYLVLSLASMRAEKTSLQSLAKVVQYVLFDWSRARSTRRMRGPWSCSNMLFKLLALLRQKSIFISGVGCVPCFSCDSGSCLRTLLICLVHVMIAPSSREILFLPVDGPPLKSIGGIGSIVSPLICPHRIVVLDKKLWNLSMISHVGTSPHFSCIWGLERTERKKSFASSSRCSKGKGPSSRTVTMEWILFIVKETGCNLTNNKTLLLENFEEIVCSNLMDSGTTKHRDSALSKKIWTASLNELNSWM